MRLSRALFKKWVAPANLEPEQTLFGKPIRDVELFERDKVKLGARLIQKAKSQLAEQTDQNGFWEQFRRRPELVPYKITQTNFENKFVDLIYETGQTDDVRMLNSLKQYFESKRLHENPVQKSAYGQLLMMLAKIEQSDAYEGQIEAIYADLKATGFLAKEVCVNFTLTYSRMSKKRFERVCEDLDLLNKSYGLRVWKRIEMMNLAFEYGAYDVYFALLRTFEYGNDIVLQQFRSKSERITDLATYLRFLETIYDASVSVCHTDMRRVSHALLNLGGYRYTVVKPKSTACPNCGEKVPRMNEKQLERLRFYFLNRTMQDASFGRLKNLDEHMMKYIDELLAHRDQLDLVIDGMNLGFQGSLKFDIKPLKHEKGGIELRTDYRKLESNLVNLVESIVSSGDYPRILFVGRRSQSQYEKLNELFVQHNIKVRYFHRNIEDDLPVILAALHNENCRILTNDYYDDHHHEIQDPQLKKLFQLFVNTRRVTVARSNQFLNYYNEGWTKRMHYNPTTKSIHVPFDSDNVLFKRLYTWGCFTKV